MPVPVAVTPLPVKFKISTTFLSFSTNVIFSAPLETHSNPKEPIPE